MEEKEAEPVKICRYCRFWSEDLKGFCRLEEEAVGQFYSCDRWEAKTSAAAEGERAEIAVEP